MTAPIAPERSSLDAREEEILRRLAEHADDTIPCEMEDGRVATWRITLRCCSVDGMLCQQHRDHVRDSVVNKHPRAFIQCMHCGHRFPPLTPYFDVYREVQL